MSLPLDVCGALLAILVLLAGAVSWTIRRAWPRQRGRRRLHGLSGPVEILRDAHGVPHVYASGLHDLMFAQGFVHAQDRMFQMDLQRRTGLGLLSELLGRGTVAVDAWHRTVGLPAAAARDLESLGPEARRALEDYTAGVNAYLRSQRVHGLEYLLLRARPRPWTPLDSLGWVKAVQWELANDWYKIVLRDRIHGLLGADRTGALYADRSPNPCAPVESDPADGACGRLAGSSGTLAGPGALAPDGLGSNVWVLGGDRTAGGRPILANDSHLAYMLPGHWYEIGLHAPGYDCVGMSMPGVFGVIVGHNEDVAWGMAIAHARVQDLFVEQVDPDDSARYLTADGFTPFEVRHERIPVKGGEPEPLTVRTSANGPVIGDYEAVLAAACQGSVVTSVLAGPEGVPSTRLLTLRWQAGVEPTSMLDALLPMNRAASAEEFRAAALGWDAPAMEFVFADVAGDIGAQMVGAVPLRADGAVSTIVPGARHRTPWTGTIPRTHLPATANPDEALIVAANADPAPPDYPYFLAPEWPARNRHERIRALLESMTSARTADMGAVQMDLVSLPAARLSPLLAAVRGVSPAAAALQPALAAWDHRMRADSVPAAVFCVAVRELVRSIVLPLLGEGLTELYLTRENQCSAFIDSILDEPDAPWWCGDRDGLLAAALDSAVSLLSSRLGPDPDGWSWGRLHFTEIRHPILRRVPLLGRFSRARFGPADGGPQSPLAVAFAGDFAGGAGPVHRHIVDLADWDGYESALVVGQSGHLLHRNYRDQLGPFARGERHRVPWNRAAVEQGTRRTLRLEPRERV